MKKHTSSHHKKRQAEAGKPRELFPIAGIGASAGGLEAFSELLSHLPSDTGLGFVLVQHLDPQHESVLSQLLTRVTPLPVHEVTNNLRVEPNHVYVIPPNTNLSIEQGVLKLQPRPAGRLPSRSIDSFFESLAQDQRERAIGVILSGTATDGTLGLEAIKGEGGITFAQDDSARYDSMPRNAIAAGCVDFVLKPEDIAKELVRIAKHPSIAGQPHETLSQEADRATPLRSGGYGIPRTGSKDTRAESQATVTNTREHGYEKLLLLLRNHSGVDFSLYKSSTILRRITRRMVLNKHDTITDYSLFCRGNVKELDALYSDVLISVTSFFRNPEAFDLLRQQVLPKLLQQRGDEPIRVWVLGCSTGQEAYSMTMAFVESMEHVRRPRRLQVFATDLNDALLEKARHGLYPKSLVHDLSPERVRRFFVEEEGGYRVIKSLREMVVFARHNLVRDPPFSRMDVISCRNLLIYLESSVQRKAIPTFHYALKPGGILFLGASESIGNFTELFEPLDKKHKIYTKKAAPTQAFHLPVPRKRDERSLPRVKPPLPLGKRQEELPEGFRAELSSQREADRVTIDQFAPPGVLINADLQILQFRGQTGAYLQPPRGKASFDVLKMACEGLMLPLRDAINKAKKNNRAVRREQLRVQQNGTTRMVTVEVIPLKNLRERCFLILFGEADKGGRAVQRTPAVQPSRPATSTRLSRREESGRLHAVEREFAETRDYLQAMQEQHEAANEELQASNEEVQSSNEELQSINEELETSKEELESVNEELTTLNEEMTNRNAELRLLNADLNNLHGSINMAIVVLARDLTIRRFTAPAAKLFNLLATDVGRPLSAVRHNLVEKETSSAVTGKEVPLEELVREVIDSVKAYEGEVSTKHGHWYLLRARPYMTVENKVDGAVLVLVDIQDLKRSEQEATVARDYAEAILRTARDPLIVLRDDLRVNTANEAFYKTFKTTSDETVGRLIYELGNQQWKIPQLRKLLEEILPRNSHFNEFEVTHEFLGIGRRIMLLNARRLESGDASPLILLAIEDVTERRRAEAATRLLASIVNSTDNAVVGNDVKGVITSWNNGAEQLFGYTAAEAIGRPVTMFMPEDRQHEESEILEGVMRQAQMQQYETVRLRHDGSRVEIAMTISPIKDKSDRVIGASLIAHDISRRKATEEALALRHGELRAQAEELTRFNRAAVGRELRMIELKQEINELCHRLGESARYSIEFYQERKTGDE